LEAVAFGWLGLTPNQLDDLTPREFENTLIGFEKLRKLDDQNSWHKFRMLASTLIAPHTKNGKGIKPEKLWPFDWDNDNVKPGKMSNERLQYIAQRSKKLKNG